MGEMSREALEAVADGLRAALVELSLKNGRLLAENAARFDAEQRSTEAANLAAKEAERLRAFAKAADAKIAQAKAQAKAEADACTAKDREQAQKDREQAQKAIGRALHAESRAAESQHAKQRAETAATLATANYNRVSEAYNVAKLHREWADRRIQDLREALVAAGVAVPAERPLGKL